MFIVDNRHRRSVCAWPGDAESVHYSCNRCIAVLHESPMHTRVRFCQLRIVTHIQLLYSIYRTRSMAHLHNLQRSRCNRALVNICDDQSAIPKGTDKIRTADCTAKQHAHCHKSFCTAPPPFQGSHTARATHISTHILTPPTEMVQESGPRRACMRSTARTLQRVLYNTIRGIHIQSWEPKLPSIGQLIDDGYVRVVAMEASILSLPSHVRSLLHVASLCNFGLRCKLLWCWWPFAGWKSAAIRNRVPADDL